MAAFLISSFSPIQFPRGLRNISKSKDFCSPPTKSLYIKIKQHFGGPMQKSSSPWLFDFFFLLEKTEVQ